MQRRSILIRAGTALTVGSGLAAFALVLVDWAEPVAASNVMALCVFAGFLLILAAPFAVPLDVARSRGGRATDLLVLWTIASACAQLGWELPFVFLHDALDGATAGDRRLFLWWAYGIADTRYITANSFVVCMEAVTSMVGGPLELYAIGLLRRGAWRRAALWSLVVAATQLYGTVLYFGLEIFEGMPHVNPADPIGFWVKFWGINAIWLVMPVVSAAIAIGLLERRDSDDAIPGSLRAGAGWARAAAE